MNTDELCVGSTCVTPEQFEAVFRGSQSSAASITTPVGDGAGAPSGSSALEMHADTPTTTTPVDAATSTPPVAPSSLLDVSSSTPLVLIPPAANDNPQPQGAEQSSHDGNAPPEPAELPDTGTQ